MSTYTMVLVGVREPQEIRSNITESTIKWQ